jgi:hypothetical protein
MTESISNGSDITRMIYKQSEKKLMTVEREKNRNGMLRDSFLQKHSSFKGSFAMTKPPSILASSQPKTQEFLRSYLSQKKDRPPVPQTTMPQNLTPKTLYGIKTRTPKDADIFVQKLHQVKTKMGTEPRITISKETLGMIATKSPKMKVGSMTSLGSSKYLVKPTTPQPNENSRFKFNSNEKKWANDSVTLFLGSSSGVEKNLVSSFQGKTPERPGMRATVTFGREGQMSAYKRAEGASNPRLK